MDLLESRNVLAIYLSTAKHLNKFENKCPYCSSRKLLSDLNSIDVKYPELLKEWNYEADYLLSKPSRAFAGDINKCWWNVRRVTTIIK